MSVEDARAVLERKAKSFALAAKLLPAAVRDDVAVLYAYCRRVDDAVDEAPRGTERARVHALMHELTSIYAGEPQADTLVAAFQRLVQRSGMPERYPRALLAGMLSDAGEVRLASVDDLLLYAYRVAGTVGVMMCYVTGLSDARALTNAVHLGIAFQLTNICRDVAEDWARGRLYLPNELLAAAGAPELGLDFSASLAASRRPVAQTVQRVLALAERYYASANAGIAALPARVGLAVRAARYLYAGIGRELERRGGDPLHGRAIVPAWRKSLLVLRALVEEGLRRTAALFTLRRVPSAASVRSRMASTHVHPLTLDT